MILSQVCFERRASAWSLQKSHSNGLSNILAEIARQRQRRRLDEMQVVYACRRAMGDGTRCTSARTDGVSSVWFWKVSPGVEIYRHPLEGGEHDVTGQGTGPDIA